MNPSEPTNHLSGAAGAPDCQALLGRTLGGYELVEFLGAGGMSCVFRAEKELGGVRVAYALKTLRAVEADDFEALPGEVFVRGFLRAYAKALGLYPAPILARYDEGRQEDETPTPLSSVAATPERGRRFGIAIAVVVLLILFTLALSIVLRPRHRDVPVELSSVETTAPVTLRA